MKKIFTLFVFSLIVLASSFALFHPEFFRVHDYIHAARVIEMSRILNDGQFPPRWSQNFGYGYGMPLFEFYAPLPYLVGSGFEQLGFGILTAVKLIFFLANLLTALGAYKLGRKFFGRWGAILTSAALTLAPYRAVNLFVRGALSEAWGIMAMPWVLWSTIEVIQKKKSAWRNLVFWLVFLMLSHNIMTLLFVPMVLIFIAFYLGYQKWTLKKKKFNYLKAVIRLGLAFLLAVGLSSFYLFPALLEKDLTQVGEIFGGYFHYSHHFLYIRQFFQVNWGYGGSAWGPDDGISFFLGHGQWLGLAVGGILVLTRIITLRNWKKIKTDRKIILLGFLSLLLGLTLYMSLLRAKPLWDVLPILSFAQFPWRFLGVGIVFLSLLVGLSASLIKKSFFRLGYSLLLLIVLLMNFRFFQPEKFLDDANQFYYTDESLIQQEMSGILPDYIPAQMTNELTPPSTLAWCENCDSEKIEVLVNRSHENLIRTNLDEAELVSFAVADFPGWEVQVDGKSVQKSVTETGNIAVLVPVGEHLVGVLLKESNARWWSDMVSVISLAIFAWILISPQKKLEK